MSLNLTIDGKKVTADPKESLLDVANRNGAEIPSLCHHPKLKPYGACRLCLVEVKRNGRTKITTSCNYEVLDGIEVTTVNDEIKRHRKMVIALLLGIAPEAKKLQGFARMYGIEEQPFKPIAPPANRKNCIVCGLCARVCEDVVGASAITMTGRGDLKGLKVPFDEVIADSCIGCGACVSVCPTGAIEMEQIAVEVLRKKPATERKCRYNMMGLMPGALCPNNYDCARCEVDQKFWEASRPNHPIFAARGLVVPPGWEV